jgi:hypothetical protein
VSVLVGDCIFPALAVAKATIRREVLKRARRTGLIPPRVELTATSVPDYPDAYELTVAVAAAGRAQGDQITLFDDE